MGRQSREDIRVQARALKGFGQDINSILEDAGDFVQESGRGELEPETVADILHDSIALFNTKPGLGNGEEAPVDLIPPAEKYEAFKKLLEDKNMAKVMAANPERAFQIFFGPYNQNHKFNDGVRYPIRILSLLNPEGSKKPKANAANVKEAALLALNHPSLQPFVKEHPERALIDGLDYLGFDDVLTHKDVAAYLETTMDKDVVLAVLWNVGSEHNKSKTADIQRFLGYSNIQDLLISRDDGVEKIFRHMPFVQASKHEITQESLKQTPDKITDILEALKRVDEQDLQPALSAILENEVFKTWLAEPSLEGKALHFDAFMKTIYDVLANVQDNDIRADLTKKTLATIKEAALPESSALKAAFGLAGTLTWEDEAEARLLVTFAHHSMKTRNERSVEEIRAEFSEVAGKGWVLDIPDPVAADKPVFTVSRTLEQKPGDNVKGEEFSNGRIVVSAPAFEPAPV